MRLNFPHGHWSVLLRHTSPHAIPSDMTWCTKGVGTSGVHKPAPFGEVNEHVIGAVDERDDGHGGEVS